MYLFTPPPLPLQPVYICKRLIHVAPDTLRGRNEAVTPNYLVKDTAQMTLANIECKKLCSSALQIHGVSLVIPPLTIIYLVALKEAFSFLKIVKSNMAQSSLGWKF